MGPAAREAVEGRTFVPRCSIYVMHSNEAQDVDRGRPWAELGHIAHFRNAWEIGRAVGAAFLRYVKRILHG
jgi:hypothetical protein